MRAVGVTGFVVDGAEGSAIDVVEIAESEVAWTVALPTGKAGETFTSADPAVIAFVQRVIGCRTTHGPAQPTSAAATPA